MFIDRELFPVPFFLSFEDDLTMAALIMHWLFIGIFNIFW
jgi:hypothetical protein